MILWLLIIVGGAFAATVVPDRFVYITGFTAGTFSFMFLQLFRGYKKN
jgi:hypothetical protein